MAVGGYCIDDVDVLRPGSTDQVLGHQVMAPSTGGTLLRSFTFGHVRQLDRLFATILLRAWEAGAGPGDAPMIIDIDSTICEVHGPDKQGAAYGYRRNRRREGRLGRRPLTSCRRDRPNWSLSQLAAVPQWRLLARLRPQVQEVLRPDPFC